MDKRCPYCGGEMLLGYMQSRDGVYWSMKKKLVPALPGLAKDELYLSAGSAAVQAYNCPKCRAILISYKDYPYDHPVFHLEGNGDEEK
ncbi:MAG: PF20097 family protein [Clostridiales bacterium]|nr:PF20097 family protein [Clostridiales bacterium]